MPPTRRLAVSYSRFSSPLQAEGDSADRQERMYRSFCQRHNLTPGKEVFADRGRSGFSGEHRTRGRLGQLLAAAKDGRFDPGTVVVVEAWDRLGRLRPDRQTELVAELLRTGVSIGVCRLDDIFAEDDFGTHKWTTLAVFIQLAHQESKQKSERVAASWEQRRKRAREDGRLVGSPLPAWIELDADGNPRLIPDRAAAVRRIYTLAAEGMGHVKIIKTLIGEKVPAFGTRIVREGRTRSQFAGRWTKPYVALLLRDRRVIGEFQPLKDDKPDGPPIAGYFPAAVSEDEYNLARAGQEQRCNKDALGRRSGPRQGKYVNLFKGLLTHARGGDGFLLHNKGTGAKPDLILLNMHGNEGRGLTYCYPYPFFEECVLKMLREIDPATVLPRAAAGPSRADVLRAKLANIRQDLARTQADLVEKYSKALVDAVRKIEEKEEATANELQDELTRTAKPLARTWEELPTLIDVIRKADDPDLARLKLRPALRALIETGVLLIVNRGSWRLAALQLLFTGGATRHYLLAYQTAGNRRPGVKLPPLSFAEAGLPDIDLRKPADMKKVEKLLARLDLSA